MKIGNPTRTTGRGIHACDRARGPGLILPSYLAGNFQGRTQTMPLAVYMALNGDLNAALALSIILVVISFVVIVAVKILARRGLIVAKD